MNREKLELLLNEYGRTIIDFENNSVILISEEISENEINNLIDRAFKETDFKLNYNKAILSDKKNILGFFVLSLDDLEKIFKFKQLIYEYDFLNYSKKKCFNLSESKKINLKYRFGYINKISFILNSILAQMQLYNSEHNFKFIFEKIYFTEITLEKYMIPIIFDKFKSINTKLLKEFDIYVDYNSLKLFLNFDVFSISRTFKTWKIRNNYYKFKYLILNDEELNEFIAKIDPLSEIDVRFQYEGEKIEKYISHVELFFEKNDIYQRKIDKILFQLKDKIIFDQNLNLFFKKRNSIENIIENTILSNEKDMIKLFTLLTDFMRYVDSEYKINSKSIVFNIEEILIDFINNIIIDLINFQLKENYLLEKISSFTSERRESSSDSIYFYEYLNILFKSILDPKKGLKNIYNFISNDYLDIKNWETAKYFSDSENSFIDEVNIKDNKYILDQEKIYFYSQSNQFRFDLNYVLNKMGFYGIYNMLLKIDFVLLSKSDSKYKNIFENGIDRSLVDSVENMIDFRNAISHQDNLKNCLSNKVIAYEESVEKILLFIKDNNIDQSYLFQIKKNDENIIEKLNKGVNGFFYYVEKYKSKFIYKKMLLFISYLRNFYKDIFGRNIFELIEVNNVKSTNNQDNFKDDLLEFEKAFEKTFDVIDDDSWYYGDIDYDDIDYDDIDYEETNEIEMQLHEIEFDF